MKNRNRTRLQPRRLTALCLLAALALACSDAPGSATSSAPDPGPRTPAVAPAPSLAPALPPNIVLIVLDTVRADHLNLYGYPRETSPALARLAAGGVVFDAAVSQAPWTAASVASLFTGLYPSVHGIDEGPEMTPPETPGALPFRKQKVLGAQHFTLAERLQAAGYRTAGFVSNVFVNSSFGFAQGFEVYDDDHADYSGEFVRAKRRGADTNERIFAWLRDPSRERDAPFFLLAHYNDAHWPYDPPAPYGREFVAGYPGKIRPEQTGFLVERAGKPLGPISVNDLKYIVGLYDGELQYLDATVGALLEELGVFEATPAGARDTVVVVTADHGEEFLDHGATSHGYTLFEEQLRVPLIVHAPARLAPRRVAAPVRVLDIAPTLLELAALPTSAERATLAPHPATPEAPMQGRSFVDLLRGEARNEAQPAFSEAVLAGGPADHAFSLRRGPLKLIVRAGDAPRSLLFDLSRDPREQQPLALDDPAQAAVRWHRALLAEASAWHEQNEALHAQLGGASEVELDDETLERLQALGYALDE